MVHQISKGQGVHLVTTMDDPRWERTLRNVKAGTHWRDLMERKARHLRSVRVTRVGPRRERIWASR